ncbi:MAG: PhnD/SsuA/transferrin family substrate-binding protein [Bryobacteraceae bacterium]
MNHNTLILGAVAYDPKVVTIWDGFQQYFADHGLPFDYVLYTNYERQVAAHMAGHIHTAWNSPLAWLETERLAARAGRRAEAIAMRDSDRDLVSTILVRAADSATSPEDLRGQRVAVGAADSPQATLIPLEVLAQHGLIAGRDFEAVLFDVLPGKHGDHIGGERDAVRALVKGETGAACILDANYGLFLKEGTLPAGAVRSILQTPLFDHCNFTVLDGGPEAEIARFRELLLGMSYADARVRRLLDLEGLKQWLPGRTEGYALLAAAADRNGYLDRTIAGIAS